MILDFKVFLFLVLVVVMSLLVIEQTIESNFNAYAHYFTSDQSAEFLSLIHQIYVEISLINNTFPLEIDSSYYHAKNVAELINKTYHFANAISPEDFRVIYQEEEQLNNHNSTVQALVMANIADEILRKYGKAYDIDFDLTNMSNMLVTHSSNAHGKERYSNNLKNSHNDELILVNIWDYQSAQALSGEAIKIFERRLMPLAQFDNDNNNNNDIVYVSKVGNSLGELNNLLINHTLPENLMKIVHTQIHPGLQLAYNLELRK